jgi:hypothetical protein
MVGLRELERDVQANRAVMRRFSCAPARPANRNATRHQEHPGDLTGRSAAAPQFAAVDPAARRGRLFFGAAAGTGIVIMRELYDVRRPRVIGAGSAPRAAAYSGPPASLAGRRASSVHSGACGVAERRRFVRPERRGRPEIALRQGNAQSA